MSTSLYLAVEDQDLLDDKWVTINRERHMVDASEETLKDALDHIYRREAEAADRADDGRLVATDDRIVISASGSHKSRTVWSIGEE
ncbi:hypothetical protein SEA_SOOS_34 [Gordonia phage Soos]|nr:hypothetical protein SEA_SOOS_34 [Gordonia phage Soos]